MMTATPDDKAMEYISCRAAQDRIIPNTAAE